MPHGSCCLYDLVNQFLGLFYAVSAVFLASFSSDMFRFELHMHPLTPVLTEVAILVTGLLSQVPALRAGRNLDLAKVVRERAS